MKKSIKMLFSTVIAVAILASSALSVFAADPEETPTTGTITITNATPSKKYDLYKIFEAEVSTNGEGGVKYKLTDNEAANAILTAANSPFTADSNGYITVSDESEVVPFLKSSLPNDAFAKAADTQTASSTTVAFTDVAFGYYYVTSDLGAAVSVTSVTKNVSIIDKNDMPRWNPEDPDTSVTPGEGGEIPPLGKFVADKVDGTYGATSTSGINQDEFFKICAHCPKYAGANEVKTYYFTDVLDAGFTYNKDATLKVGSDAAIQPSEDGPFKVSFDEDTNTITFTYVLPSDYVTSDIVIMYSAMTDKDATPTINNKVDMDWTYLPYGTEESALPTDPNDNPVYPSTDDKIDLDDDGDKDDDYPSSDSDNPTDTDPLFPPTPPRKGTETYVYSLDIIKTDGENQISGAQFKLYTLGENDAKTEIKVVSTGSGTYRVMENGESATAAVIEAGKATIFGFDKDQEIYYEEVKAPAGYNPLKDGDTYTMKGDNKDELTVVNNKGAELPSTGGMGTTIFIVAGSVLMAGAFIGIITKKRMSLKDEEQ